MKKLLISILLVVLLSCDKDESPESLPPATQTGEDTFGCLVNGKMFIDKSIYSYYQLVEGEYYFGVGGGDDNIVPENIQIQTENKQIFEGETYQLTSLAEGNAYGGAAFDDAFQIVYTNEQFLGQITITNLDYDSKIVSGTFWFDVQHPVTGETVEIRDGRFDTHFSE